VTVLYYGLVKDEDTPPWFESRLARGARLVTVALPLVEVLPNRVDYPFCLKATVISELFSKSWGVSFRPPVDTTPSSLTGDCAL
jgi:hypothetical protein